MAQYKHNFYGTSYYGKTNAYSGVYETDEILTEEPLNNTFTFTIKADLPQAHYDYTKEEIERNHEEWSAHTSNSGNVYIKSSRADTKVFFKGTCDAFTLHYLAGPDGSRDVKIEIKTIQTNNVETKQTFTLNTYAATFQEKVHRIEGLPFGQQEVLIYLGPTHSTNTYLYFWKLVVDATHITVETRARYGSKGAWTNYAPCTYTKQLVNGRTFILTGNSPSYAGKDRIQVRLYLASSDNKLSPIIYEIKTVSGDTNNRTEDGYWIADINMNEVARGIGKTFARVKSVDWNDETPVGTYITYRSQSSSNGTTWTPRTIPYRKGTYRVRLKEGRQYGYVTSTLIDPTARNRYLTNLGWTTWEDISHVPPDDVSTGITYYFLDSKDNEMLRIEDPWKAQSHLLEALGGRPFKLRIRLFRRFDKSSPAVDEITFQNRLYFEQDKVVSNTTISAVDNFNTGEKRVFDLSTLTYDFPPEIGKHDVTYKLIDETTRPPELGPNDVYIYLESEKDQISRSNETSNPNDKVWAVARGRNADEEGGALRHYQYGGGVSYYDDIRSVEMTSAFTPSLKSNKEYRYYVKSGWPTQYHTVRPGETLNTIALLYGTTVEDILSLPQNAYLNEPADIKGTPQSVYNEDGTIKPQYQVEIPNDTLNENVSVYWKSEEGVPAKQRTNLTEKSAHNARLRNIASLENDEVAGLVAEAYAKGEVDWVSDEKTYEGVINLNNIPKAYDRVHRVPDSGVDMEHSHTVKEGETYESIAELYGVYEEDIRWKNNAIDKSPTDSPAPGTVLIIPAKVILPIIPPEVKISESPYEVQIIHNSVRVRGELADNSIINHVQLEIEYVEDERTRVPVKRGSTPHTADALPNSNIIEVIGVYNSLEESVDAPYYIQGTDYLVVNNYIDWSLTSAMSQEPPSGSEYYVSYRYRKPVGVRVIIDSDYQVQIGADKLWRSSEIKEFTGICEPDKDFVQELPPFTEWPDYNTKDVYGLEYVIEDNDLWVKTWIEEKNGKSYIRGSLLGKQPKDYWAPYIHTGYYYLGKEEYYLFSEEKVESFAESDVPIAKNVSYVQGKYSNAVRLEKASKNFIRNSGFQVSNQKQTIRKITF